MSEKQQIKPKMRFPEFRGKEEWAVKKLGDLVELIEDRAGAKKYTLMSVTAGVGLVSQIEKFGREIAGNAYKNYYVIKKGDFAYNKSATKQFPEGYIAMLNEHEEAALPNSIFICFRFKDKDSCPKYFDHIFHANYHGNWLRKFIAVGARAHGSLNVDTDNLLEMPFYLPFHNEQQRIADCLTSLDDLIAAEAQKLDAYEAHKKGLMQMLFPVEGETVQKLRFSEFLESEEWEEKAISELLDYERPDQYIVNDTDYKKKGIPVLTANKSFILGYTDENFGIYIDTPVIIFDDFTVDNKYVDFSFKVKSSAIKILKAKQDNVIKFIYELIGTIQFDPKEHKRYYISVYQNIMVRVPKQKEQQRIADCLSSLDELISVQAKKIEALKVHKKGLMQGLFPSLDEVEE
jgi:type I restriction enzyme, S subunit